MNPIRIRGDIAPRSPTGFSNGSEVKVPKVVGDSPPMSPFGSEMGDSSLIAPSDAPYEERIAHATAEILKVIRLTAHLRKNINEEADEEDADLMNSPSMCKLKSAKKSSINIASVSRLRTTM